MTDDNCRHFLESPEEHEGHLQRCPSCRALAETLDDGPDVHSVSIPTLPMAGWEGATHRSWRLLAAVAIAIAAAAGVVLAMLGTTPLVLFRGRVPSADVLLSMATLAGGAIQNAPRVWQVLIVIAFVVVNGIFVALLRRTPKGIDV